MNATPYTDGDVRRLVALIDEGQYHDSAIHPESMARRLLAAGVTLPPDRAAGAEARERWEARAKELEANLVKAERDDARAEVARHCERADRLDAELQAEQVRNSEARAEVERLTSHVERWKNEAEYTQERVDKLLAEIDRLRDKASARAVEATELALEDARAELIREREDRDLERDLFAARVKELEAERPDQPVTTEMVYEAIEAAEIRGGLNPGYGPMYVRPCDWTRAEAAAVADALNRLLADRAVAWAPPGAGR